MYVFILGHLIHKNRLYSEGEWTLKSIRKSWSSQKNKVHFVILKTGNAIKVFKKKTTTWEDIVEMDNGDSCRTM